MKNRDVQKVLFITSSRIGDAVLSSGLLDFVQEEYPNAKVTICCGPLVVSLFEGVPALERIIPIKKQSYNKHWYILWKEIVGTCFDIVIDLRNSIVSRLICARRRYIYGNHINKELAKVKQNASVMGLDSVPDPKLCFTEEQKKRALELISEGGPVLGIGPTSNWVGKTWPEDRFIEIIQWLIGKGGLMEGSRVAVFGAPGEEGVAKRVLSTVPDGRRLDIIAKGTPGDAAACLARCDFYIGNDSGLMHCAAAVGIPTLGLFGPGYPDIYGPWGKHTAIACTLETVHELTGYAGYSSKECGCLMGTLSVEHVKDVITKNWPHLIAASS
ncbi:MAG: glycosyltransferase family 9 protein [Alphaproteobacteria bacterium]|nr:glycosyltransferase family 9 protein [Alphaproteobacteria bacterium]